jgi:hypothetical protein
MLYAHDLFVSAKEISSLLAALASQSFVRATQSIGL